MSRRDIPGVTNMGYGPRSRDTPTRALAMLDKGRRTQLRTKNQSSSVKRSQYTHVDCQTPLGYSHAFEAYLSFSTHVKDVWCSPSCICLHQAAASGNLQKLSAALSAESPYTRKHGIDEQDDEGRTAAMVSAWRGQFEALKLLVENGARLNIQDKEGRSVLHWVLINRSKTATAMLEYLCAKNLDVLQKDRHGQTCLHKCAETGYLEAALLLTKTFPRLCVIKDRNGKRPVDLIKPSDVKLINAVSVEAASRIVRQEQERLRALAILMDDHEVQEEMATKMKELELMSRKRRQVVVATAGMAGPAIKNSIRKFGDIDDAYDDFAMLAWDLSKDPLIMREEQVMIATAENFDHFSKLCGYDTKIETARNAGLGAPKRDHDDSSSDYHE